MNRWQGWARHLRTRHARSAPGHRAGAMVLLRAHVAGPAALHSRLHASVHLHTHFAAQFAVRALATAARPAAAAVPVPPGVAPAQPVLRQPLQGTGRSPVGMAPVPSAPEQAGRAVPVAPMGGLACARRIVTGHPRAAGLPGIGATARADAPGAAQRAATVLRLQRQAVRDETRPAAPPVLLTGAQPRPAQESSVAAGAAQLRTQLEQARTAAVQAAPAIDVGALTGMVIEQIDRRMLAYRERMGRG